MPSPIVRVIGATRFIGPPPEMIPQEKDAIQHKKQLQGSDCACLIETAGRCCYDSLGSGRPSAEYHQHIKEVGHGSVTEHAVINFYLDNISRGCTHELVRHRAGCAISQRSTRYVDESGSPWILHPLLERLLDDPTLNDRLGRERPDLGLSPYTLKGTIGHGIDLAKKAYDTVVAVLQAELIKGGVDKFTARKQARGAARGLLGNALCTSMVWSANIRALRTVIEQRANPAADAEIRVLANRIYEEASKVCPEYFDDYEKVACPDGIGYGLTTKYRKI